MRLSNYLLPTYKETPNDAEIVSHQLMLRAGMIRKLSSGLYSWLPLGLRVLRNVEKIVREEMNRSGALEVLLPSTIPAELWQETGRWETFGPQLLKMRDRHDREYCFGPTHEEVITDCLRHELKSYKQLPLNVYQIATKFRDEIRPRFGVMRAREFIMKDAYSFHLDAECLGKTYDIMYETYQRIFTRLGLSFRAVLADNGSIGGSRSHEFQVLADSGEDTIFYSDQSEYAANVELACALAPMGALAQPAGPLELVPTPGQRTIAEVSSYLKVDPKTTVKTIILQGSETPLVMLVLRGDHDLNEVKADKLPEVKSPLTFATDEEIIKSFGCPPGYLGPVKAPDNMPIIADLDAAHLANFVCGANKVDAHLSNVNWKRDADYLRAVDLRNVMEGDQSPDGKGVLRQCRGIEVGHVFALGTKYSESMKATVVNEQGQVTNMHMGCYGIGVSRIVAAAIEQNHDEFGIVWPEAMAPFQIALVPMNMHKSERLKAAIDKLYDELTSAGYEVLLDDRNERAGVMFADNDLIGLPHRLVLGERGLDAGTIEYKRRQDKEAQAIPMANIMEFLQAALGTARNSV